MRWWLYNVLFSIGFVLMLPRFLWRMWRRGGYRKGFMQRLGLYDAELSARLREQPRVWIHAVSVGEVYVALRFMRGAREAHDDIAFVLTTNTSTGHRLAAGRLHPDDVLAYVPVDFLPVVRRVLSAIRPRALVLTESELWPNMIRETHARGIPIMLLNGRVSASSYRGYHRLRGFFGPVVRCIDRCLVQGEDDRDRLCAVGATADRVRVLGTAKYDVAESDTGGEAQAVEVLAACGIDDRAPIIVGGSTWPGEEEALVESFLELRKEFSGLALVLVPRHAERRDEVVAALQRLGVDFVLRSRMSEGGLTPADVLLVDTTGELRHFYARATVIFVGKSLTNHGGQNVIEPALYGRAIVVGPNMENFLVVMHDFLSADAIVQVPDAAGLHAELRELLRDEARRKALGTRAARVVQDKRGVIDHSVRELQTLLNATLPN